MCCLLGAISERTCAGRRLFDSRQEAATKARKRGREHALSEAEGALAPPNPRYARKGSRGRLPHIFARATKNVLPDVDISGAAAQVEAEAASATNFAANFVPVLRTFDSHRYAQIDGTRTGMRIEIESGIRRNAHRDSAGAGANFPSTGGLAVGRDVSTTGRGTQAALDVFQAKSTRSGLGFDFTAA